MFAVFICFVFALFYLYNRFPSLPPQITVAASTIPVNIIPETLPDTQTGSLLPNIFEGLVRFRRGNCDVEPCLAESYRVSPDGRSWIFILRQGVRCHNGHLLTAPTVVAAFTRKHSAATKSQYLRLLFGMIARIEAPDQRQVIFHLKYPYAPFLRNLALPQAAIYLPGTPPVGTGPYKVESVGQSTLLLKAHATYWGSKPSVARVLIRAVPDPNQRLRLLQKRKAAIALDIPLTAANRLPSATLTKTTGLAVGYLGFYTEKPPFTNPTVRRALARLIDRSALCRNLYGGFFVFSHRALTAAR